MMTFLERDIRRGRKFDQVLEGARKVFLANGFDGSSVDDIARAAGVSKATLYSYFPDKRVLFMEVAKSECQRQADEAKALTNLAEPPGVVLRLAAERMVGFFLSDLAQGVFRICVAEREKFPELGQEFYESGPMVARARLKEYFRQATERGELRIEDFDLAADQFAELCKADLFPRTVFGISRRFTEDEVRRVIDGAVEMFLARYAPRD